MEAPSREPRLLEGGGRARDAISTKSGTLGAATFERCNNGCYRRRRHQRPRPSSSVRAISHARYETTRWAPSEGRRRAVQQPLKLPRQHRKMAQRYQCRHTRRPALVPRRPSRRVACVRQHPPRVPPARPVTSGVERARPAGDGAARESAAESLAGARTACLENRDTEKKDVVVLEIKAPVGGIGSRGPPA